MLCVCATLSLVPESGFSDSRVSRMELDSKVSGLSGLSFGFDGKLFAVAERERVMVVLSLQSRRVSDEYEIVGVPPGLDLESLAYLGGARFAVGTESLTPMRASDPILILEKKGKEMVVRSSTLAFDYSRFGMSASPNAGVEALCAVPGAIFAGAEPVLANPRRAPLLRFESDGSVTPFELELTSNEGKLSALACRPNESGVMFIGIERHYGISRVIRFVIGRAEKARVVRVGEIIDLAPSLGDAIPNLEGIEWLSESKIATLSDSSAGVFASKTFAVIIELNRPARP